MSFQPLSPLESTRETRLAATACMERLADEALDLHCPTLSPRDVMQAIVRSLEQDAAIRDQAWIVRSADEKYGGDADPHGATVTEGRNVSAWHLRLRNERRRFEKPLLYLLQSESLAGLRAALLETASHGIFCNDAEAKPLRWPKSVQPTVPLWLSSFEGGMPYDPASGLETLAIVRQALRALYVERMPGFFYLSAHAEACDVQALSQTDAEHAFKGMYCLTASQNNTSVGVRLLGAGKALAQVRRAADLLQEDWNIPSEIWSCPSYTRLARESHEAEHWNMLHPLSTKRVSHLQACLNGNGTPVVAVTGYSQHISSQIAGFISARCVSIGADSPAPRASSPDARWIAVVALKALGDDGHIPMRLVEDALKRYGLT